MRDTLRLYIETSVFGYAIPNPKTDREKHEATISLFNKIRTGKLEGYVSEATLAELEAAPGTALRQKLLDFVTHNGLRSLPPSNEVRKLAGLIINNGLVPKSKAADAEHLAMMAVHPHLDVLVSWNYKHIVNVKVDRHLTPILLEAGYRIGFTIATPLEIVHNR